MSKDQRETSIGEIIAVIGLVLLLAYCAKTEEMTNESCKWVSTRHLTPVQLKQCEDSLR